MNVQETILPMFYKLGAIVIIGAVASIALKMFFSWLSSPKQKG